MISSISSISVALRPSRGPARGFRPSFSPPWEMGFLDFLSANHRASLCPCRCALRHRARAGRTSPRAWRSIRRPSWPPPPVRRPSPSLSPPPGSRYPSTRASAATRPTRAVRGDARPRVPRAAPGAATTPHPPRAHQSSSDSETRGAGRRRRRLVLPVARPLDRRRASLHPNDPPRTTPDTAPPPTTTALPSARRPRLAQLP